MEATDMAKRAASRVAGRFGVAGDFVNFVEARAAEQVRERLGYLLANGKVARQVLDKLSEADRKLVRSALVQLSAKVGMFSPQLDNDTAN
jgi:hypothetical protein